MSKLSALQRKAFDAYDAALANYTALGVKHEQATRHPFAVLLETYARPKGWTLVLEQELPGKRIRPDATLLDEMQLPRGYWEAKDADDVLEVEIKRKIDRGYPLSNTIFEDTRRAVLYQNGRLAVEAQITNRAEFAALLDQFFDFTEEQVADFYQAVKVFGEKIPELAGALKTIIATERKGNARFIAAFDAFHALCRAALNPDLRAETIEEMLVQHLLTERLFRTIFNNSDFAQRNAIAIEIEKVIRALTSRAFSRTEFLKRLDHFYTTIEATAASLADFAQKQAFLNTVYERFFQDFSRKQADTHGIVYTPQPIVDFQCASIEVILQREFGLTLADSRVALIDPCVGTGNYVVNLLNRVPRSALKRKYQSELWCNEIMLLPYYIASLNIEHTYFERTGEYAPFEGICFADTLELVERDQPFLPMLGEENTERVVKQRQAPITVVVGNPPYNVGQKSENENNKNRPHKEIERRVRETYAKDSKATNKNALDDPYVKFFRWAVDRLGDRDGIVCFVSNNSFVDQIAFDGMRRHLAQDFTAIYHLDLHGNVRKNPKLSGTTHNVFGIQVGVGITVLVRRRTPIPNPSPVDEKRIDRGRAQTLPLSNSFTVRRGELEGGPATIYYHRVPKDWRKSEKLAFLTTQRDITGIEWQTLTPDAKHNWLTEGMQADFEFFLPMGSKETKSLKGADAQAIFKTYGRGVVTSRDDWAYDFDRARLAEKMQRLIENYNGEVDRWARRRVKPISVDEFVDNDETKIKWSRDLKLDLQRGKYADFTEGKLRPVQYRPFCKQYVFFDRVMNEEVYIFPSIFPAQNSENQAICMTGVGTERPFATFISNTITDLNFYGPGTVPQWFPLYVYDEDGSNRRDNITDWALAEFQKNLTGLAAQAAGDLSGLDRPLTKRDIFHYVYAMLHHPVYRERYAENLKRELPRIPITPLQLPPFGNASEQGEGAPTLPLSNSFTVRRGEPEGGSFWQFIRLGEQLAHLHLTYEQAAEYPLQWIENKTVPFSWRVERMKLSPDKTAVVVNEALTLAGIPKEALDYRLGNRSALEWIIDQYRVSTDKASGLTSDPNRADDPEYIVRLIGRVITVSMETMAIIAQLPA